MVEPRLKAAGSNGLFSWAIFCDPVELFSCFFSPV
jgi:hypothetical protein